MLRVLDLLFNGKRPVDVSTVVHAKRVEPQRRKLAHEMERIQKSYKRIGFEAKKMKKTIDTSLAIAIATGGIR